MKTQKIHGRTALHQAVRRNDIEAVKKIFKECKELDFIDMQDDLKKTALHYAVDTGNVGLVKLLVKHGASLEVMDIIGNTALHYAIDENVAMVSILLQSGAKVDTINCKFDTPLNLIATTNDTGIARLLINHGAKVDRKTITSAVERNHVNMVGLLLDNGIIDQVDDYHNSFLHLAVFAGSLEVAELLLKRGFELDCRNNEKDTPLLCAAYLKDKEMVSLLLEYGANTKAQNSLSCSSLYYAVYNNNYELAELLLENKADPNIPNTRFRETVIFTAIKNNNLDMVKLLIEHGANIQCRDAYKNSVFDCAAQTLKDYIDEDDTIVENCIDILQVVLKNNSSFTCDDENVLDYIIDYYQNSYIESESINKVLECLEKYRAKEEQEESQGMTL